MKKAETASEITTSRIQLDLLGLRDGEAEGKGDCGVSAQFEAGVDSGCCCPGDELISLV